MVDAAPSIQARARPFFRVSVPRPSPTRSSTWDLGVRRVRAGLKTLEREEMDVWVYRTLDLVRVAGEPWSDGGTFSLSTAVSILALNGVVRPRFEGVSFRRAGELGWVIVAVVVDTAVDGNAGEQKISSCRFVGADLVGGAARRVEEVRETPALGLTDTLLSDHFSSL